MAEMHLDSTGQPVRIGDTVRFRGQNYTIKEFIPGEGRFGTARIVFNEPQHTPEEADEISIDLIDPSASREPSPYGDGE